MSGNPCSCLTAIVSHDPAVVNAMSYLLKVILRCDADVLDDDINWADGRITGNPDAFFLHAGKEDPVFLSRVRLLKARSPETVVIAMLSDLPDFGALALEAGADDVIHWPTNLKEVALRFRNQIGSKWNPDAELDFESDWDAGSYISAAADLTVAESQILRVLMAKDGKIVTRDELSMTLDDRPWRHGDRKFDVHMTKIRRKLQSAFGNRVAVFSIRSRGYRLSTNGRYTTPYAE